MKFWYAKKHKITIARIFGEFAFKFYLEADLKFQSNNHFLFLLESFFLNKSENFYIY